MKLADLTPEQRTRIEADEVGQELLSDLVYGVISGYGEGEHDQTCKEIKRTIKRIDDEIDNLAYFESCENNCKKCRDEMMDRLRVLYKQKALYQLMEQLE